MLRLSHERILVIGDIEREVESALMQAMPAAQVTNVGSYFDGIAELATSAYTAVLAATEPIQRRPEPAVKTLRSLLPEGRLILFGDPGLEPLSRKMLNLGCDDYIITPPNAQELQTMFGTPLLRIMPRPMEQEPSVDEVPELPLAASAREALLRGVPLTEVVLDALLQHPTDAPGAAVRQIGQMIAPTMQLFYTELNRDVPGAAEGLQVLSHAVRHNNQEAGQVHLVIPQDDDESAARHFVSQLAHLLGKMVNLQDRHNRLQKLAITDDLTGVYNRRYFEHFLSRILEKARSLKFSVTLLLFDIDGFKQYNDQYGHGVGDQILIETARLMRQCCREHDLVARIGGDEFAVVFWEKEGPRQPKDGRPMVVPARPPQTPVQIFERFRRLLSTSQFPGLGAAGQGLLTISGGLASFPWDGRSMAELITAADNALMQGAKASGKDRLVLVGSNDPLQAESAD